MKKRMLLTIFLAAIFVISGFYSVNAWTPMPVKDDPLVRMPGSQPPPENNIRLEGPGRCNNCHGRYNSAVEPDFNWRGSMMAQSARDFMFWACLTTAAQDSIYAIGRPNATDICLRCHVPKGWLEGRSDPTNGSLMTGDDFAGVQCDFCHNKFDPFFEGTYRGIREGSDWLNYWDETNTSTTPSNTSALRTYNADLIAAQNILLFNGGKFFGVDNYPFSAAYTENAGGQYFMGGTRDKRASFADANARHAILYSRYHKSKYFCSTCHDVSNPILANLVLGGVGVNETRANFTGTTRTLWTENNPAYSYFHVERTFSEFMLSDYGLQGGAPGKGPFAPTVFTTSKPNNYIASCQDCHMRDVVGRACSQSSGIVRPTGSIEHPKSGQPLHDMTGGNAWVMYVLASAISGSPNYDATNFSLLRQGPAALTLDLTQGEGFNNPQALIAGVERAKQQLRMAASITDVSFSNGMLRFRVQNNTGHKLISGFPEGRRMFVNIKAYDNAGILIYEVNPYDYAASTLKGLTYNYQPDPDITIGPALPTPAALGPNEVYIDSLVYEAQMSSAITGEDKTFHFALATDRYKDNRIPPKGFRISDAPSRLVQPRWAGADAPAYFTSAEYSGGYDEVSVSLPSTTAYIEIRLYYQTTSREYIEFLRDEIKGNPNNMTLPANAYIVQTDPFFSRLKAWGDTIWKLWKNNRNVATAAPFLMAEATWGTPPQQQCVMPGTPQNLTAIGGNRSVALSWTAGSPAPTTGGYRIYYDQAGKLQYRASVPANTTTYTDTGLKRATQYCYRVTAWNDCNGNGIFDSEIDYESPVSNIACATTK